MASQFDINALNIVDTWLSTLFYGMNVVVYSICVYVLLNKRRGWRSHKILLATTTLTFSLTTCHVGFSLRELIKGFIIEPKTHPTDPAAATLAYFSNLADSLDVAKIALYGINTWVADLLLIWRLHAVWQQNWRLTVVPLIVEAAYAGCYLTLIVRLSRLGPGVSAFIPWLFNWALAGWSLHLFVNISVTSLIAWRLYSLRKLFEQAGMKGQSQVAGVLVTIVESGAVYSATTVLLLCLGAAESIANFAIIGAATQLAVLSPTLIVVRIGLGLAHTPTTNDITTLKAASRSHGKPQHLTLNIPSNENSIGVFALDDIESQSTRDASGIVPVKETGSERVTHNS